MLRLRLPHVLPAPQAHGGGQGALPDGRPRRADLGGLEAHRGRYPRGRGGDAGGRRAALPEAPGGPELPTLCGDAVRRQGGRRGPARHGRAPHVRVSRLRRDLRPRGRPPPADPWRQGVQERRRVGRPGLRLHHGPVGRVLHADRPAVRAPGLGLPPQQGPGPPAGGRSRRGRHLSHELGNLGRRLFAPVPARRTVRDRLRDQNSQGPDAPADGQRRERHRGRRGTRLLPARGLRGVLRAAQRAALLDRQLEGGQRARGHAHPPARRGPRPRWR